MRLHCLVVLIFVATFTHGQEPVPTGPPRFDIGTIDAGFYINNCLGFSYPIPEGWEINNEILGTSPGAAKHDGGGLILLIVDQHTKRPFFNRMVLSATDSTAVALDTSEFVSRFVHAQTKDDQSGRKILKESYAVDLAGKQFFRADFTDSHPDATLYKTFLATKFRNHFLGWTIVAGSADEVDLAAGSLKKAVFQQDQVDRTCVMGAEEKPSEMIGGVIGSTPALPHVAMPRRVRISQSVSNALIVKKVQPIYPEDARYNRIEGSVVLKAEIDTEGNVQDLALVSGPPSLVRAAIEAVKQWKYKPYFLNGTPVNVETQVTIIFTLQLR